MQIEKGADVYTSSGEKLGHVDRVVMDPHTKKVSHLVVRKGFLLKTDKVLPIDWVAAANGDRVALTLDATGLDSLPNFEEKHYVRADETVSMAEASGGTPASQSGAAPEVVWYPPVMGGPGLTAVPIAPRARFVQTVEENIPENTVALKEGAKVVSADGEHVGSVERLIVNSETKDVTHLLVKEGVLFTKKKVVPADWIGETYEDEVHLVVDSKLLHGLPDYEG